MLAAARGSFGVLSMIGLGLARVAPRDGVYSAPTPAESVVAVSEQPCDERYDPRPVEQPLRIGRRFLRAFGTRCAHPKFVGVGAGSAKPLAFHSVRQDVSRQRRLPRGAVHGRQGTGAFSVRAMRAGPLALMVGASASRRCTGGRSGLLRCSASRSAVAARGKAPRCARGVSSRADESDCPEAVAGQCTSWLTAVTEALPTSVTTFLIGNEQDREWVRVTVDGVTQPDAPLGRAVPLDPGHHVVGWTRSDGAYVQQGFVLARVRKGTRHRSQCRQQRPARPERAAAAGCRSAFMP